MSPTPRLWDLIAASHRTGDLHECVRATRATVDGQPYDLPPRYLLAALYVALGQHGLALLQYERLLPLAVGRGELFLALAAQRRLDELHPKVTLHERRYHAMHQWFVSLSRSERRRRPAERVGEFGPHVLVSLPSADFAAVAEACRVETLPTEPVTLSPENGLLWVVLHGRVRWTATCGPDGTAEEQIAEPGDYIVVDPAPGQDVRVRIVAETPVECLSLDPELLAPAEERAVEPPESAAPVAEAAVEEQVAELVAAAAASEPAAPVTSEPATDASPATPAAEPRPRVARPVPDPTVEPMLAVGAPIERRRETRLSVQVANGVVLLGLAGTRVAPLPGALVNLSVTGMGARFRRGDLLQVRGPLRNAVVSVHLALPGREGAVRVASRVTWVDDDSKSNDPESALGIGLEFMAMGPALQQRLESIVAGATASART